MKIRYAHTSLVAGDWRRLAAFYQTALGCEQVSAERDIEADWLARATGVEGARLRGVHLRLPGYDEQGPTLEIFQYDSSLPRAGGPAANRLGLGHIAFAVDDVSQAHARVLAAGGREVGETVHATIDGVGGITFVYVADPEGNIIELQRWD